MHICVLNATINKYTYGTLRPRTDRQIRIESVELGHSLSYAVDEVLAYDGRLDLVKAAIRGLGGQGSEGFDLFLHSDAPPGTGLGSSSALMVALVGLLKEFGNLPLTDYEIAHTAYVLERVELGIKGGLQDQYAGTFGGFNFIEFYKDQVIVNPLRVSRDTVNELEHNLLLCYTGQTRLSDRIIEDQTTRYARGQEETVLGLRQQKALATAMKNEEARAKGALGGKISGAGGGGYMFFYCRFERKHRVADALTRLGAVPASFAFESRGLQTWRVDDDSA